jgi:hypothetical protein
MFMTTDRNLPDVALDRHVFGHRLVFLEMISGPVHVEGCGVVVDLECRRRARDLGIVRIGSWQCGRSQARSDMRAAAKPSYSITSSARPSRS